MLNIREKVIEKYKIYESWKEKISESKHYIEYIKCLRQKYYKILGIIPSKKQLDTMKLRHFYDMTIKKSIADVFINQDLPRVYEHKHPDLSMPLIFRYDGFHNTSGVIIQPFYSARFSIWQKLLDDYFVRPYTPLLYFLPAGIESILLYYFSTRSFKAFQFYMSKDKEKNEGMITFTSYFSQKTQISLSECLQPYKKLERHLEFLKPPKRPYPCYFRQGSPLIKVRDNNLYYYSSKICFYCDYIYHCWLQDKEGIDISSL